MGVSGSGLPHSRCGPLGLRSPAHSVAGVEKRLGCWDDDVCQGEKPSSFPVLTLLHSGMCKQLGQVVEATRNQEKVVGEMSRQLEVPPQKKIWTGL